MSRFVRPETVRLDISNGDWLLVKKRINAGEMRERLMRVYASGQRNDLDSGGALIAAYLLDWSLTDDDGKPVKIAGLSPAELSQVLDGLDQDSFGEIGMVIEAHEKSMQGERAAQKKSGDTTSSKAISPSPLSVDGGTSGLPN